MSIWTKQKLSEICDVRDGTHDSPKPSNSGHPLVTSKHIINNRVDLAETYLISNHDYDLVNRRSKVDKNDILISMIGTVGEAAFIKESPEFAIKNVGLIKTGDEILGRYLYYYLISPIGRKTLHTFLSGSTQKFISLSKLRNFPVFVPPKEIQRKIVLVIKVYDDLIENNEKRIKTLEEMAQRVYTEWFIKLKFPRYEKACMIDSGTEFGKIPEGWSIGNFADIVNVLMGLSPQGKFYNLRKEGLPLLNGAGDFAGENMIPERFTSQVTRIAKKGDIIFCIRGTIGNVTIADRDYCIGRGVAALSAKEEYYSYSLFILKSIIRRLNHISTGAVIRGISRDDIAKYKVLMPPKRILIEFAQTVDSAVLQREKLRRINFILEKIRNLLISQFITGKRELS